MRDKLIKALGCLFLLGCALVLALGFARSFFFPEEINEYENRYAERVSPFTLSGYAEGSFQDSVEAALADQLPLSSTLKRGFNRVSSRLTLGLVRRLLRAVPDRYLYLGNVSLFGPEANLVYLSYPADRYREAFEAKAANINAAADERFYLYYIEKDTDVNFQTGEKNGAYAFLRERLTLPPEHVACYEIRDFADFESKFYKTDHHWNCDGSYLAYTELLTLLGVEEEPLPKGERFLVNGSFSGSKAIGPYAAAFREPLYAYRFDFPPMEITVEGSPAADYGHQNAAGDAGTNYGYYYGGDCGSVVFRTGREDREKLLVLGESYDNALLKLLASHFNETHAVDLRYYEHTMGEPFRLWDYMEAHRIDKVLLIGNIDYYIMDTFMLEAP